MALHRFSGVVSRHDSYPDSNLFLTLYSTLYSQYRVQSKVLATVRSVAVFPIAHIRYRLRYHRRALGKTAMVFVSIVAGRPSSDWDGSLCAKPLWEKRALIV